MLVLTRKLNEQVHIYLGDKLVGKINVNDITRSKVKIGLDFNPEFRIVREELEVNK